MKRSCRRSSGWIWLIVFSSAISGVDGANARGSRLQSTHNDNDAVEDEDGYWSWMDLDALEEEKVGSSKDRDSNLLPKKLRSSYRQRDMLQRQTSITVIDEEEDDEADTFEATGFVSVTGSPDIPQPSQQTRSPKPISGITVRIPTALPTRSPKPTPAPTPVGQQPVVQQQSTNEQQSSSQTCDANGFSRFPFQGRDSSERLLLREGVIDELPTSRCGNAGRKNVILVIGDGMGWEMARAGAIARQVINELETTFGCNITSGCPTNTAAMDAFRGRNLSDYYTEGKGRGLSFQNLPGYALVTTTATLAQRPNKGNNSAPPYGMLEGSLAKHDSGMAPLALTECGWPIDFDPKDHITDGGNMVLWDDVKGGQYPWDPRYTQDNPDTSDGFDPLYIMQHATDSAATATTLATGHKVANTMVSVDLYEEPISTIVEEAMKCGMAGGVVSSKPVLHATPAAFIAHSNNRQQRDQLRRSFREVNPSFASGVCAREYYPYPEDLQSMRNGSLSRSWTLFEQKPSVLAENFYQGLENLDPDNGDHVLVCLGGDFTRSNREDLPKRGVDSSYSNRWCGTGDIQTPGPNATNPDLPLGVTPPNARLCDFYSQEEVKQIPHITQNVKAALDFLGRDDDGFFLMYEQGDIDTAAHQNHMDDLLGTLLDIDDSVQYIRNWIAANGGYEKNALYVTADHDHYLTLLPQFPELLALLLITGASHNITPENNSKQNPWNLAIQAGRHEELGKSIIEHLRDFTTWTDEDILNVGHFWGPVGSGGNGWGSHSTRPVPLYYQGDGGCIEQLLGKGYQVLGRQVEGIPGKIDQAHIHACMMKNLFAL
ncbi:Alkaline phosphatase H [Seminavis robusta]|uniref:alkaline phosphatase n=1 Tax=Seminavis robusta TaxID=568900 RepID=A0A9N8F428_9STRA|nr:Alkaline phosphatase H [Seminavis robusta]|eukprot:Sro3222_g345520.1 Alkaline phosphatase H (828) ;mRNA; r:2916-5800